MARTLFLNLADCDKFKTTDSSDERIKTASHQPIFRGDLCPFNTFNLKTGQLEYIEEGQEVLLQ